jgi:hypothetical protein
MVSYPGSFASNTYTVPFGGLYFVHGYVAAQNFSGILKAGVNINSTTTFWGPKTPMPGGGEAAATKTQIFSLNAGDTITLKALASAAANTSTAHPARLVVVYVGAQGVPSQVGAPTPHQPIPPDTTFRWTAGQTGPQSDFFNNHVANDLIFLTQRPYFLGYQATGGQAITPSSPTGINLGTVAGIVHNDNGDNYSGWNIGTNKYVAPVSGWYMAVEEIFLAQPTLTSTPSVVALLGLTPGGADWDRYQQQNMITSGEGSGATAVSYYYLRAGDSIQAGVETYDSTSTTINTSTVENSHMELVWLGE